MKLVAGLEKAVENEECPVGSGGSIYLLSHGDGSFSM